MKGKKSFLWKGCTSLAVFGLLVTASYGIAPHLARASSPAGFTSVSFRDNDDDGTVDRLVVEISAGGEDLTTCDVSGTEIASDWTYVGNDIGGSLASATCDLSTETVTFVISGASPNTTGGSTLPTIAYNNNDLDDSIANGSGALGNIGATSADDQARPVIGSASTGPYTTGGVQTLDGFVHSFAVTLTEDIDPATIDLDGSDFVVNSCAKGDATRTVTEAEIIAANQVRVYVTAETDPDFDTGDVCTVELQTGNDGDVLKDGSFNESLPGVTKVAGDSTPFTFVDSVTADDDGDGHIDQIVLTASEDLNGATVAGGDFAVTGYTIASASETSAGVVTIVLTEKTTGDTDATPSTDYDNTSAGAINDVNSIPRSVNQNLSPTDEADPVILTSNPVDGAVNASRINNITFRYSEEMSDPGTVALYQGIIPIGISGSYSSGVYTINPDDNLDPLTAYDVVIANAMSTSGTDNDFNGGFGFTTRSSLSSGGGGGGGPTTVPVTETACMITSPNGGQIWQAGSVHNITWTSTGQGINNLVIYHQSVANGPWNLIVAGTPNDGSYEWTVPTTLSNASRIRIECRDSGAGTLDTDESDATFSIAVEGTTEDDVPPVSNLLSRAEANNLLPFDYPVDSLVKLADDGDPNTTVDAAVYYIGLDAKRHPFPSAAIYFSWYEDFSSVRTIDVATLADIDLGTPVLVRPGTYWVKIQSDNKTYFVSPGHTLRWIEDEATARLLGGANWNQNIIDIEPTFFARFVVGEKISASDLVGSWPAGSLVRQPGTSDIWYVGEDNRRWISSDAALRANHFQSRFVEEIDGGWMNVAEGLDIVGTEDHLFSEMVP